MTDAAAAGAVQGLDRGETLREGRGASSWAQHMARSRPRVYERAGSNAMCVEKTVKIYELVIPNQLRFELPSVSTLFYEA